MKCRCSRVATPWPSRAGSRTRNRSWRGSRASRSKCGRARWCGAIFTHRTVGAMSPDLSVVLCTWNRAELLRGALDALLAQTDAPHHEILVVDNASTDDTRDVMSAFLVHRS